MRLPTEKLYDALEVMDKIDAHKQSWQEVNDLLHQVECHITDALDVLETLDITDGALITLRNHIKDLSRVWEKGEVAKL